MSTKAQRPHAHASRPARRGMVIAVLVVILVMANLLVLVVATGGVSRMPVDIARVDGLRARAAADAGLIVTAREASFARALPAPGTTTALPGNASLRWIAAPPAGVPGTASFEGLAGNALRAASADYIP